MPDLGVYKSGVFDPNQTSVNPVEAFRRDEMMKRQQLLDQQIRANLAAQVERERIQSAERMPDLSANAALRVQGGTGMDMARMEGDTKRDIARTSIMPAMGGLQLDESRFKAERQDAAVGRLQAAQSAFDAGSIDQDTLAAIRNATMRDLAMEKVAEQSAQAAPQAKARPKFEVGGKFYVPTPAGGGQAGPVATGTGGVQGAPAPLTRKGVASTLEQQALESLRGGQVGAGQRMLEAAEGLKPALKPDEAAFTNTWSQYLGSGPDDERRQALTFAGRDKQRQFDELVSKALEDDVVTAQENAGLQDTKRRLAGERIENVEQVYRQSQPGEEARQAAAGLKYLVEQLYETNVAISPQVVDQALRLEQMVRRFLQGEGFRPEEITRYIEEELGAKRISELANKTRPQYAR